MSAGLADDFRDALILAMTFDVDKESVIPVDFAARTFSIWVKLIELRLKTVNTSAKDPGRWSVVNITEVLSLPEISVSLFDKIKNRVMFRCRSSIASNNE